MQKIDVEVYEKGAPNSRKGESLHISSFSRECLLKETGFSTAELNKVIIDIRKVKRNRVHSKDFAKLHFLFFNFKAAVKSKASFFLENKVKTP